MKKRILAILSLILAFVLLSCGAPETPAAPETAAPVSPTETGVIDCPAPDRPRDLGGHEFRFTVRDTENVFINTNEVYAAAETGDKVNDAVFKRNALLAVKFNCSISERREINAAAAVREGLLAGEYVCDFIYTNVDMLRTLKGLLVDLNTVKTLDLDRDFWDQHFREGFETGGKLFFATGDAGTADDRAAFILLCNRRILRENGCDPYALVTAGEWTVEKMYEMSEACWEDRDGDGVFSPNGVDVAAYFGESSMNWIHAAACGARLSEKDASGGLTLPDRLSEDLLQIWSELRPLLTSPHRVISDRGTLFRSGKATFFGVSCGNILANFADGAMDLGFLPFPKRSAEQAEYLTSVRGYGVAAYAIPVTVNAMPDAAGFESGAELCGYFLNAFAYESQTYVTLALYDQLLRKQSVRDEESIEMLVLALKNKVYDPVVMFNFGSIGSIFAACSTGVDHGTSFSVPQAASDACYDLLSDLYGSRLAAARESLARYLDLIDVDTNA